MASQYDLPYTGPQVETLLAKISELESEMPSKTSDLTNDSGFITSADVPTKTSDLNNDSGFITNAPVAAEAARAQAAEALLATISSLQAEISRATGVEGTLQNLIDGIAAKIPSAATEQNQLADKAFVNSSIATATAEFRGTYNSLAELQAVSADENDYGYVRTTDAAGNTIFKRYKYASGSWVFEYDLNNSSFTASQWAAINSAITAELVEKLRALPTNAALTELLNGKQGVIPDLDTIRANAAKGGTAYQKPSGGIPKTDLAQDVQTVLDNAEGALTQNDIADNLTTNDPTKPLSAKQGVVLDGKISQLGQEVEDLDLEINGGGQDVFDSLVFEQGGISTANGSNQSSMQQVRSDFIVAQSLRVTVTNGSVYVYGWNGDTYLSAIGWKTGTNDFEIAGATKYKLAFKLPSGNLTPAGVGDLGASVYLPIRGDVVKCVSQTLNDTEKQTARENIGAASEEYVGGNSLAEEIDLSAYQDEMYYITPGGSWALNSGQGRSKNVTIVPGEKYRITNNKSNESYYAFLHSLTGQTTTGVVDYAAGYSGRTPLASGQSADIIAPDNAKYLYILKSYTGGTDVLPNVYEVKKTITQRVEDLENREQGGADLARIFESIPMPIDADGYELPLTFGMNAALKKAEQGCQIKYVAKKAYPTLTDPTGAAAGEKTGFPYSSVKEMAKFIHWHVSERTFMTAINNEYGLFYTEDVASNNSRSDYGYTYHGVNCGPYYGMVCNIFALWCLGYPVPFDTAQFAYLASKGVLVRLNNQTAQTAHICDLVWYQGHTALVTSVKHDEYGNVTEVKITESLGHVHETTFTAAQFDTYLHITHDAILYRPTFVYKNTYQPSEFIGVRGEATPSAYGYNDDICFFAGDYAAWKLGENAWVNYTKGSFTGMKIYKDNTLVNTVTLDNDSSVHKINITSYINGAGDYKACLTDGTNDSDFTYWQMVEATASYSNGVVSFESANGTPWYIQVCSSNGSAYCWYEITQKDIINGEVALDLAAMVAEQYGDVSVTQYVRVAFKTEYGGVVSDMIQI